MKHKAHLLARKLLAIPAVLALIINTFIVPALPAHAASSTIFTTQTPAVAVSTDTGAVELGAKFTSDTAGTVTGIRFYKGDATNGGTHYGHLWSASGSQLAEVQFTGETSSGWQDATFSSPVTIAAGTTYVASYYAPQGHYSYDSNGFASSVDNAPLHALANSTSPNGVFTYTNSSTGGFPSSTYNATNYWVDVDFTAGSGGGGGNTNTYNTLWPSTATPAVFTANDTSANELGVKFTSDTNGVVNGIRFFKGDATNGGTHYGHLWDTAGNKLAEVQFTGETSSGWQDMQFASPVNITAGTTYIASYYSPQGHYSYTAQGFASGVDNSPLHAPANSVTPNGVFLSTGNATGGFPNQTFNANNYWVDLDFTPAAPANIWPSSTTPANADSNDPASVSVGVKFQSDTAGYISGVRFYKGSSYNTGTHVGSLWSANGSLLAQATFTNETGSGWQDVKFNGSVPVQANTTYIASYYAPTGHYSYDGAADLNNLNTAVNNPPLHALASSTSGGNGVYAYGSSPTWPYISYNSSNYWVDVDFTTYYQAPTPAAQATPRSGIRGSGPVLVLTDPNNAYSDDYCNSLLKAEGLMECAATDTGNLTSTFDLSPYRVVVLADGAPLTPAQVTQITNWTSAGGTFVAMRPDDNLDSLLGIGPRAQASLTDAYFKVAPAELPGIETQTMQYHAAADQHALNGATTMATLYSDSATATSYPAVTTRTVGSGQALAFMFDLAKSVVYTRDGNPGFAGENTVSTDGQARFVDRFGHGWLDPSKAAIPQADEQQRMLVNIVENAAATPRLWYFPSYKGGVTKAALVLTGDDHATSSQTLNRFAAETAADPSGCSVADWTCYTSTSYAYAGAFSDSAAKPYADAGFEVSPHVSSSGSCSSGWKTQADLNTIFNTDVNGWDTSYPTISAAYAPLTERFHCYGIWNDYSSIPTVEASHGIKADTNSPCWPNQFLNVAQCLFTGSGIPEPYADASGNLTGVQQFTTQATDENPSTVTQAAIDGLVTNATGSNGYYGYFTLLCHLDNLAISNSCATAALNVAQTESVPMVSARQAETFYDARNASTISSPTYGTSSLSFNVGTSAHNLQLMVPATYNGHALTSVTVGGQAVTTVSLTVSGVTYAVVNIPSGSNDVVASY